MSEPSVRLYGIPLSHPVLTARGMLDHKGLSYRYVELVAGAHPPILWALGFRHSTVPAMTLANGRRVQGTPRIARALEQIAPSRPLYPSGHELRAAVQSAERWGEEVLQPVPRRLIRWGMWRSLRQRQWFAGAASPLPAPRLGGVLMTPIIPLFARQAGASDARVRGDLAELPGLMDEVERLLAQGVIGGEQLGAADYQIAPSVRMLLAMRDVAPYLAGRPAAGLALRVVPDYPEIPASLPPDWLPGRSNQPERA